MASYSFFFYSFVSRDLRESHGRSRDLRGIPQGQIGRVRGSQVRSRGVSKNLWGASKGFKSVPGGVMCISRVSPGVPSGVRVLPEDLRVVPGAPNGSKGSQGHFRGLQEGFRESQGHLKRSQRCSKWSQERFKGPMRFQVGTWRFQDPFGGVSGDPKGFQGGSRGLRSARRTLIDVLGAFPVVSGDSRGL